MKTILMKFFSSTLLLFFTFFTFSQDINWMEFEKFKKSETKKFIGQNDNSIFLLKNNKTKWVHTADKSRNSSNRKFNPI